MEYICDHCKKQVNCKMQPSRDVVFDCGMYERRKRPTNADRIRAMSDEELAGLLIYSEENYKLFTTDGKDFYTYEEALKHEIEWLKSPTTD